MKKKIVIASVLKPVDDVRACWKLSQSMTKTNKYEVNIIGNASKKAIRHENIIVYPHELMRTQWIKRIMIREVILWKIVKIKPEILIITTPELLKTALISKMLIGCKIIYDVQENYYLNATQINPNIVKKLYGLFIRLKEVVTRPFITEYWLAEACYEKQLKFVNSKNNIIENKALAYTLKSNKNDQINVLFSGTVSTYSGVKRALTFYKELHKIRPDTKLNIIGQVHDLNLKMELESESKNLSGLQLNISQDPIPYHEILKAIEEANLGIIGYCPNPVNREKIPTKLYEYSRYKLPYLVQTETYWSQIGKQLGGAISVDFSDLNIMEIIEIHNNSSNLFPKDYHTEATWEFESNKLIASIDNLSI